MPSRRLGHLIVTETTEEDKKVKHCHFTTRAMKDDRAYIAQSSDPDMKTRIIAQIPFAHIRNAAGAKALASLMEAIPPEASLWDAIGELILDAGDAIGAYEARKKIPH